MPLAFQWDSSSERPQGPSQGLLPPGAPEAREGLSVGAGAWEGPACSLVGAGSWWRGPSGALEACEHPPPPGPHPPNTIPDSRFPIPLLGGWQKKLLHQWLGHVGGGWQRGHTPGETRPP